MVRNPIEYVVTCMEGSAASAYDARPDWWLESMGMSLFYPPNPSGWQRNGYWISSTAQWAKADFARHLAWLTVRREHLIQVTQLGVPAAVNLVTSFYGIEDVGPSTRAALENYLYAERATWEWPQHANLLTLAMLTPDVQVA
jgi:hypothetical protein